MKLWMEASLPVAWKMRALRQALLLAPFAGASPSADTPGDTTPPLLRARYIRQRCIEKATSAAAQAPAGAATGTVAGGAGGGLEPLAYTPKEFTLTAEVEKVCAVCVRCQHVVPDKAAFPGTVMYARAAGRSRSTL